MKRKFFSIAKKYDVSIIEYKSERSDMGCQCFVIHVELGIMKSKWLYYGYYVGEGDEARNKTLIEFKNDLKSLTNVKKTIIK